MKDQILVRFKPDDYDKIVTVADKNGLGKSTLVRLITLKVIDDAINL